MNSAEVENSFSFAADTSAPIAEVSPVECCTCRVSPRPGSEGQKQFRCPVSEERRDRFDHLNSKGPYVK